MIHIEYFTFNAFMERCSIVWDDDRNCAIIDPGFYTAGERDMLYGFIEERKLSVKAILLTHGHFDHIFGVAEAAGHYEVPVYMHSADKVILDEANPALCAAFRLKVPDALYRTEETDGQADAASGLTLHYVKEGDSIEIGSMKFEVIETPGHTPGGVCYLERDGKVLFSGDTLFAGSIGRTDNQWADYDALMAGIFGKLMELDGDISVIPGHGPATSIATERTTNPFLMPFNEPFEE
jgi:glyoxylase-like metal-dependent hydrolase (beta-lactamase superfamily II)